MRALLREAGLKLGTPSRKDFSARTRDLVAGEPVLEALAEPLLGVIDVMNIQVELLNRQVLHEVKSEPVCRRLMTVPGVGPLTALAYRATLDRPDQFRRLRDVGAHLGLTSRRYQSGEVEVQGGVSCCGDELTRTALYEATQSLLIRSTRWSALRALGMAVAKRRGMNRARVAVARKLAVILHRMWADGAECRWRKQPAPVAWHRRLTPRIPVSVQAGRSRVPPAGTMGEAIPLRARNRVRQRTEVAKQIGTPHPPHPIVRRPRADPKRSE